MGQRIDLTQQVQGILPEANGGAGPNVGLRFADSEVPSGAVNGSNTTFTLAFAPNPPLSLLWFVAKTLQIQGTDYTLSGATITTTAPPTSGASSVSWYRYRLFGQALAFSDGLVLVDNFSLEAPVAALPLNPVDQLTIIDSLSFFMATSFAPLSDQMLMADVIQLFDYPDTFEVFEALSLQDSFALLFGERKALTDTMALSDFIAKGFPEQVEILTDTEILHDAFLFQMQPVLYQFEEALNLVDAIATFIDAELTLSDFMAIATVSDPFNATLSGVWTQMDGSLSYDGTTGLQVATADNSFAFMKRNDIASFPTAQFATCTVVAVQSAGNMRIGPMINIQGSGVQGYFANLEGSALTIWKVTAAGAATTLTSGGGAGRQFTNGDIMTLQNDGTGVLSVLKNGSSVLSVTDHVYTGGTVGVGSHGGVQATRVNTWSGGPLTPIGLADAFTKTLA